MTIYTSTERLAPPPDNLTIPQFLLDEQHPLRQIRKDGATGKPWLIDDESGRSYGLEEVRARVFGLANAMKKRWNIGQWEIRAAFFSASTVQITLVRVRNLGSSGRTSTYPGLATLGPGGDIPQIIPQRYGQHTVWARSPAAPTHPTQSLNFHQLEAVKATLLFTSPSALRTAISAARKARLSVNRVILLVPPSAYGSYESSLPLGLRPVTADELVKEGLQEPGPPLFHETILPKGGNQKKVAFLSFSSGTTGKPKAVAIAHYSVISNVLQFATSNHNNDPAIPLSAAKFNAGEVATCVLPLFHIYGLVINLHLSLFSGLSLVIFSKFNWVEFLKSLVKYQVTHLFIVPPQVVLFVKHPETKKYDLSRIKYCMAGAAPISPELQKNFQQILPNSRMTETSTVLTMPPISQREGGTLGSAGQLVAGTEAKVVKPDGSLAKIGEEGELYVRGAQCHFNSYFNNDAANAETFVDGWVRTGDGVFFHENGDMFIVDRLKACTRPTIDIAPAELEGHLLDHPDVNDACVVGVQDEYSGEVPLAFICLAPQAARRCTGNVKQSDVVKTSIKKHVSDHKIRYKWLDGGVEFVDVIPKNPSGKLLRRFLRDKAKELRRAQISQGDTKTKL
ncbi:hypothetical protein FRB97_000026 [Tulasnella sp. 331]|nr:hypothetical protein FRB97_000026 [Tulasnella sp. 331]